MKRSSEITTLVFTCYFFFITLCTYGIEKKKWKSEKTGNKSNNEKYKNKEKKVK